MKHRFFDALLISFGPDFKNVEVNIILIILRRGWADKRSTETALLACKDKKRYINMIGSLTSCAWKTSWQIQLDNHATDKTFPDWLAGI